MSDNEELSINLDPSIKNLLKEKFPNFKIRAPVIKALSICTEKFLEVIIQESADIGIEKDKNTMANEHVYEALEKKHFNSIIQEAQNFGQEIEQEIKKRKEIMKMPKAQAKTEEERIEEARKLKEAAMLELKKMRQAEAAALKSSDA